MPTTEEPNFDYQTYMKQNPPELGQIRRGTAARAERREVTKSKITIRIDADIIDQFKQMVPAGQGYQSLMNQALREWLMAQGVTELVREELQALTEKVMVALQETSRRS